MRMAGKVSALGASLLGTAIIAALGAEQLTHAVEKVERLRRTTEEISAVLELITHLASQTNLLALNATIDAIVAQ